MSSTFQIYQSSDDGWSSLECPLKEGIHVIANHGDDAFDDPLWVVVQKQGDQWVACSTASEEAAFDIHLDKDGEGENLCPLTKDDEENLFLDNL